MIRDDEEGEEMISNSTHNKKIHARAMCDGVGLVKRVHTLFQTECTSSPKKWKRCDKMCER